MSLGNQHVKSETFEHTVVANPPKTLIGWTAKGSANPDAAVYISRRRVNDAFLRAALESFHKDGPAAFQKCARENPASYLKIFALLVPRELKIEHANPASALSDEQLALMIAELEERIARRVAAGEAKQIDVEPTAGEATTPLVLEPPKRRQNRLMMEADTAIGPRERKPRKRKAKPPGKRDAE
jgi:hypothetical protein